MPPSNEVVVQKWRAHLERVRHTSSIDFGENVPREIKGDVDGLRFQQAVAAATSIHHRDDALGRVIVSKLGSQRRRE